MAAKDPLSPRKQPVQERSRATVAAILTAAAQVFAEHGSAGATTNSIARRAGVSVGSLYEYFPNKESLLVALLEREVDEMLETLLHRLDEVGDDAATASDWLAGFVVAVLDVHARKPEFHRMAFEEGPHPGELHGCVLRMEADLAHRLQEILVTRFAWVPRDPHATAHLMLQTIEALTHRYAEHGLQGLDRAEFIEGVVALLRGALNDDSL